MKLFYCDSAATELLDDRYAFYSERKKELFHSAKWDNGYCTDGIRELNQTLKYDCTINNLSAAVFFKDDALEILQKARPMRYYGDWLLLIGLAARGLVCYSPLPLNNCRIHAASLLNAPTNELLSKREYYQILMTLIRHPLISEKRKLRIHFSFNYLSFGIYKDGLRLAAAMIKEYISSYPALGVCVITDIVRIKLFYRHFKKRFALKIDEF